MKKTIGVVLLGIMCAATAMAQVAILKGSGTTLSKEYSHNENPKSFSDKSRAYLVTREPVLDAGGSYVMPDSLGGTSACYVVEFWTESGTKAKYYEARKSAARREIFQDREGKLVSVMLRMVGDEEPQTTTYAYVDARTDSLYSKNVTGFTLFNIVRGVTTKATLSGLGCSMETGLKLNDVGVWVPFRRAETWSNQALVAIRDAKLSLKANTMANGDAAALGSLDAGLWWVIDTLKSQGYAESP